LPLSIPHLHGRIRRLQGKGFRVMPKTGIHPNYHEIKVVCACGNNFTTRSTNKGDIHAEICSNCHPFFTGKQKLVDTAGRVERFTKKYEKAAEAQKVMREANKKKKHAGKQ